MTGRCHSWESNGRLQEKEGIVVCVSAAYCILHTTRSDCLGSLLCVADRQTRQYCTSLAPQACLPLASSRSPSSASSVALNDWASRDYRHTATLLSKHNASPVVDLLTATVALQYATQHAEPTISYIAGPLELSTASRTQLATDISNQLQYLQH